MLEMRDLWEGGEMLAQSGQLLIPPAIVVDDLPAHKSIADGEVFIIRNCESRYLTHLFHKYPGKFIPHIPRWALHRYLRPRQGAVVLDPFVGSGTTLVESYLYGQHGLGLDVDPLARLISKVKSTAIPEARLHDLVGEVTDLLNSTSTGTFRPAIPTLRHWFTEQAVTDLSAIYAVVDRFRTEPDVYDFLTVCFSSIIRRASNADNQTMKTYVSHTNPKNPEPAQPLFLKTLSMYALRLAQFSRIVPQEGSVQILSADDARSIADTWQAHGLPYVDLAIASPPYIKSVNYIYNQMAELFWLGDRWGLQDQAHQNAMQSRYIGNDRVSARESSELLQTGVAEVDGYISQVYAHDRKLGHVMWRYFRDLDLHLSAMRSILKPEGHYVMVVGDSTLAGISVPTHNLLAACAQRLGYRVVCQFAYEIRNKYMHFPRGGRGGVVEHDWVLDLARDALE